MYKLEKSLTTEKKQLAPTAVASLVLGILSINFGMLVIPGFILSVIGKKKAQEGFSAIAANPDAYTGEGMLKAGQTTSKVGFILSFVGIAFWIFYILFLAVLFSSY